MDWNSMLTPENSPKCGELPTLPPPDSSNVGSCETNSGAGYSDCSPHSPHSPHKKQPKGVDNNLTTHAGKLDGKFFCEQNRGVGALVNLQIAPDEGVECGQCDHLTMQQFNRPKDRRLFHWRCSKGFNILEAAYAGERVLIAQPECDSFMGPS